MDIVFALLPAALGLALLAVIAYIWAAKSGQFDDLETPARRMLIDDKPLRRKQPSPTDNASETENNKG
ncbi:MAG: cbb3-type cytochrome oxidase assembly protein CcoS [bacterium]|nr:cbb3-type cytochrome oxidase assembly protein CcoS [bacterium]